jgi:hypothetical protein
MTKRNAWVTRYRGTFEPENNGPIITAEFVDARCYDELLNAARKVCYYDWSDCDEDAAVAIEDLRRLLP